MRMTNSRIHFQPGITTLLKNHRPWIKSKKTGLVTHLAAVDKDGASSVELLNAIPDTQLTALFAPEHGFLGAAPPGEKVPDSKHKDLSIPIFSLYGVHRKPTRRMLKDVDTIIVDLQDLGARPYTYVSTLRLVMEAAQEYGKDVIIADRPIPLPTTVDGPLLDPLFGSFVGLLPVPMSYGMTPAETAIWMKRHLKIDVDLKIAPMRGYHRQPMRGSDWPPWIPPSPGIKSWESGHCYTATVFSEALPIVDIDRQSGLAFRVLGAPGLNSLQFCKDLNAAKLNGINFHTHRFIASSEPHKGKLLEGTRMTVTDPEKFMPITTAITILCSIQKHLSMKRIWNFPGTRHDFFDHLFGTDKVRKMLMSNENAPSIIKSWQADLATFNKSRQKCLLYKPQNAKN